jgi:hypothetical protein
MGESGGVGRAPAPGFVVLSLGGGAPDASWALFLIECRVHGAPRRPLRDQDRTRQKPMDLDRPHITQIETGIR